MKSLFTVLLVLFTWVAATAQCSICTKTAQQLGEKPAKALNTGIIYLMLVPFAVMGGIGYHYYNLSKREAAENEQP